MPGWPPKGVRWYMVGVLTGFWIVGMVALRSTLWVAWVSYFLALSYVVLGGAESPSEESPEQPARRRL